MQRKLLFGMDFGNQIGKFSNTKRSDREIKLKKLEIGKDLLIWLSTITNQNYLPHQNQLRDLKK